MVIASTPLTLDQFVALPEEEPGLEFAGGVVSPKMSPKGRHSVLQAELVKRFDLAGLPGNVARAFPELRVTFSGASRVPDVAVYRWHRIPRDSSGDVADDFRTAPDVAVEIVSPEQSINALVRRCLWYVAEGVGIALLVDPADKSVVAFRPGGYLHAWHGADRIDLGEALPGFRLTVDELFAALR